MVRVRFAPSPTGFLHIGGLRTALYNYLFAKNQGGVFILRIEDTDQTRYVEGAIESLLRTLSIMGINPDEGPFLEDNKIKQIGEFGPYIQSERTSLYREYIKKLIENKTAYYCFCSQERLDNLRKEQELAKMTTKYDRHCLHLTKEEIEKKLEANEPYVIRLKIPEGETRFEDIIRGPITISNQEVDDQVLIKSDGFPTYHLANVVDDHLMGITHVIRAEEWLSSVPKHVILYKSFGWEAPQFAHLPLVLNKDRSKLSKRQGDVAVEDFLAKGYLPQTLINFIALLGFNPKADQEIYTKEELINAFDISKINKSGAVFDEQKLLWMNGQYIRLQTGFDLIKSIKPFLSSNEVSIDENFLERICSVEKERASLLSELAQKISDYLQIPSYDPSLLVWKKADKQDARKHLEAISAIVGSCSEEKFQSILEIEVMIKGYIQTNQFSNGNVLWPTRVALCGLAQSPSPFELLWIFGKEESLRRLNHAIKLL
ncbi:glutamate--tRNA ligase [Candidatus Uhrbacteria bacterium CG_4_9_14_3_um_filter_36_7]|uniref:Glutamate--tRNA ligase n=1 Tax=Candidatus Uhrbacteria bacterium CG_4_9_14_3_um_filter_36_7 TaxID=1975033 RepID=A0A2M7XIG9_9BACT|nr:MAG: glutamate--tRNA ligase [Candidatus Uhrbacteria bacterium CG_4_9_14_3_um_filter_36_7]